MAGGITAAMADANVDCCPVGDGGEGTLAAIASAIEGEIVRTPVCGALRSIATGEFGVFMHRELVYVESASAIALAAIPVRQRNVMAASSFGVGELMLRAAQERPSRLVVGLGGSATTDGGCGMAQAIGVRFFDRDDRLLEQPISAGMLGRIGRIDASGKSQALEGIDIIAACDVQNPLTGPAGAALVYGPQKGASDAEAVQLDDDLRRLAGLIRRDLGRDVEALPGAGAAGGLGAGLMAFAGASAASGIDLVLDIVGFAGRVRGADLCLTGEGRLDDQSMYGKACMGVARAAAASAVPTVALVGAAGPGAERCLEAGLDAYVLIGASLPASQSMRQAERLLARAAADVAQQYRHKAATIGAVATDGAP